MSKLLVAKCIIFLLVVFSFISCRTNDEKNDYFCKIENIEQYYDGMTFNINMSLEKDCYDVDQLTSGMRIFDPFWVEINDDTLFLKKYSPWAYMVSDSCLKAGGCPHKTQLSFGRMKRTNLRKSNYKWFLAWLDSTKTKGEYLFPKGTKKTPFNKFSQKCLKVEIPCFGEGDPPNIEYHFSGRDSRGISCFYCGN